MTQTAFAAILGVSRSAIAQIESSNNNPSRDLILTIIEKMDLPLDLKADLENFVNGNKISASDTLKDVDLKFDINNTAKYSTLWLAYKEMVKKKNDLLILCIHLKELHNYKFSSEDIAVLNKIDNALQYLENTTKGQMNFNENVYKKIEGYLAICDKLNIEYSNIITLSYSSKIRDFNDLFSPKEYNDRDLENSF